MTWTILLVDDEVDSLEPLRLILEEEYRVLTAENGNQALSVLENEKVQMVIADQHMPGMTGVELLIGVRDFNPDVVRLILTAHTDFEPLLAAINEGLVYRYIIKTWDINEMLLTIRQAMEWRELRIAKGRLAADLAEANRSLARRTGDLEKAQRAMTQQEKTAAVSKFAAEVVHRMNNYLQIVVGISNDMTDLRKEEIDRMKAEIDRKKEEMDRLLALEDQARSIAGMAEDIRDSTLGAKLPYSLMEDSPLDLAEEVIRICSCHSHLREMTARLEAGETPSWTFDRRQVKHLLLNLVKNAAQASEPGSEIEIFVGLDGDEMVWRVIDHGAGISNGTRENVCEPFNSTRQLDLREFGLNICRQVAEAHGGSINCEETPGGGSTFTFRVPRAVSRPE